VLPFRGAITPHSPESSATTPGESAHELATHNDRAPQPRNPPDVTGHVLVAGIGNLFLGDEGFGPEVVRRLAAGGSPPSGVRVVDYGIRGMRLAYDLLDGWDALVLVEALPATGGPPGQVIVTEFGPDDLETGDVEAHGPQPVAVLGSLTAMGGKLPPTFLVGCPVESTREGIGLSPAMSAAVPAAIDTVLDLLELFERNDPRPLSFE
jgi:hydrogenase maturation protease